MVIGPGPEKRPIDKPHPHKIGHGILHVLGQFFNFLGMGHVTSDEAQDHSYNHPAFKCSSRGQQPFLMVNGKSVDDWRK